MSLFGNLNKNPAQPAQSGGLFAGLGTAQPAQQNTGGLFGGLGGNATATGTSQAQTSGGLFGGLGLGGNAAATGASQAQPTGGLFNRTTSQPQPGGGLFGASTQAPQQQQSNASLGGSSLMQQQQQQQTQNMGGNLAESANQNSLFGATGRQNGQNSTSYFDSILEKSRKRGLAEPIDEELPQLQLGLGDLRQRMKRFAPDHSDKAVDGKAHYLLAASGVDPGAALRDLNTFSATAAQSQNIRIPDVPDTDIDGYLANLQTQTTLSMISEGLDRSIREFDAFLEDNVNMEWDAQRKKVYQHFGIKQRQDTYAGSSAGLPAPSETQGGFGRSRRSKAAGLGGSRVNGGFGNSSFGRSSLQKSVIGIPTAVGGSQPIFADIEKRMETIGVAPPDPNDRVRRERESRYIEKAQRLNNARLEQKCFPILHEFSTAVEGGEDLSNPLYKAYRAVIEMVGESPGIKNRNVDGAVAERQYSKEYLASSNSRANVAIRRRILRGSTKFLQDLFYTELEGYIAKSPREANLGGIPNILSKVQAYVRLRASRKDLVSDNSDLQILGEDYVWALLFYLLRSGHVREAADYVQKNLNAFTAIDRSFPKYIAAYNSSKDNLLDADSRASIQSEYSQRQRIAPENSIDPYRMACYKIIGRCDLRNRNLDGVTITMEDYMWIQFVLAREFNEGEEISSETCNLSSVQKMVQEIGQRYFLKGENYGVYFFLQILAGIFEEAVAALYVHSYPDAVHFAIALSYYGLLRVSDPTNGENALLTKNTKENSELKFGHMLGHYTRDFRAANASAAVDYFTFICLNRDLEGEGGVRQVTLCHEALRELVLESREFALLLGDIRGDGQRIQGVIEQRAKLIGLQEKDEFMRAITIQAASVADDNGRTTDAVLLYHLAQEFDNVLVVINRSLSEAVSVPIGQEQARLQPLKPRVTLGSQRDPHQTNSLSLTSVDDPVVLARNMMALYSQSGMYKEYIKESNWNECEALLKMSEAKSFVEQGMWSRALDMIEELQILPIKARGNASLIRSYATKFSSLSPPLANALPNILTWAIHCTSSQLVQSGGAYGGNDGTRELFLEQLRQDIMDLTTYTSQLRYRFPPSVLEMLAKAQR